MKNRSPRSPEDIQREKNFVRRAATIAEKSVDELVQHDTDWGNRMFMFADYFSHEYPKNIFLRVCLIVVCWELYGTGRSNSKVKPHLKYLNQLNNPQSEEALTYLSKKKLEIDRKGYKKQSAA